MAGLLLRGWLVLVASAPHAGLADEDGRVEFDIPEQRADSALIAFAEQADVSVLFPFDAVSRLTANELIGSYGISGGLDVLLDGTGLEAAFSENGQLTVRVEELTERGMEMKESKGFLASLVAALASLGAPTEPAEAQESAATSVEEVVVTGTRIQRDGMSTATPVTSMGVDELRAMAPTTLIDALDQMPQFLGNLTPATVNTWTGNAAASILNLRGVGSNRTLSLLDGRRIVPSTRLGTTDVNIFPEGIVERVETVTGGASAAYGSDAISGVVNFVLDTDFTGFEANVQGGVTSRGQQENRKISLSAGTSLGERSHVLFAADYYDAAGIESWDEYEWFESWGMFTNPDWSAADPPGTNPQRIYAPNLHTRSYTPGGLITGGPLAGTQFLPDGTPAPFFDGDIVSGSVQSGGSGYDIATYYWPITGNERSSIFTRFTHEVGDNFEFYAQLLQGRSEADRDKGPNMLFGPWAATIYRDNAYLPDSIAAQMDAAGVESFPFARAGPQDLGGSRAIMDNTTTSYTVGVDGDLGDWRLRTYYQYGQNEQIVELTDTVRIDRIYRSMDAVMDPATGGIVCRSTLTVPDDGCVPTSFFGDGAVTASARDWIQDDNALLQDVEQHFVELTVDNDIYEGWGAGPVSLALGVSYRRESFDQTGRIPDVYTGGPNCFEGAAESAAAGYRGIPPAYRGCVGRFERGSIIPNSGEFDVNEIFAETIIPLVSGAPAAEALDINLAWRYADYAGSGGVDAWKAGINWSLTEAVRLRTTASRDIRAGTLSERFDTSTGGAAADDPAIPGIPNYAFTQRSGGNPEVDPEFADTYVFGIVFQPTGLSGFGMSVDYFDIQIDGAISTFGVQNTIDECYLNNVQTFCDRITRGDPIPGTEFEDLGPITLVDNTFTNVDQARARGIDFETSYRRPLNVFGRPGNFAIRAIFSRLLESSTTVDGVKDRTEGQTNRPGLRGNLSLTYSTGGWDVNVQRNYIGPTVRDNDWISGIDIANNDVASFSTTNLRIGYEFGPGDQPWDVYLHARNVFDEDPPLAPANFGTFFGSGHTDGGTFDEFGRRYTLGMRVSF